MLLKPWFSGVSRLFHHKLHQRAQLSRLTGRCSSRSPRQIHPSVEILEDRSLLSDTPILVKDINSLASSASSSPSGFVDVDGTLFFVTRTQTGISELWKSDLTESGTVLVKSFADAGNSFVFELTAVSDKLFFVASNDGERDLWTSDGTSEGTVQVMTINKSGSYFSPNLTGIEGKLFFVADDGVHGAELWTSDGTEIGTALVKDIHEGRQGSSLESLTSVGNKLFFRADDGSNGDELWMSDGTDDGTMLVKDINEGELGSSLFELTSVGNKLFFRADDGINGEELWMSDGTEAGSLLVKDIALENNGAFPNQLTDVNGILFFSANDGTNGNELWSSDGTSEGTVLVKNIQEGIGGSYPSALTVVGTTLFFVANDGDKGVELWRSNGSEEGTTLVKDISAGFSNITSLTEVAGKLFFQANDGINGFELWKSDGTESGTVLVKDIRPGSVGSEDSYYGHYYGGNLTDFQGLLVFQANDGAHGVELWKSDGIEVGTTLVKDFADGTNGSNPFSLTSVGNTVFFRADDGIHGSELWKTNGTATGTVLVKDINPTGSSLRNYQSGLTNVGGTLFFVADDGVHGQDLWKSNGTEAGTVLVKDFAKGNYYYGGNIGSLTNVGGTLFFVVDDGEHGRELWKSNGTAAGTVLVKDIRPEGSGLSNYGSLTNVGGTLFFVADDGVNGRELWKTNGTAAGTVLVKDIKEGDVGSYPNNLMEVNGRLFFTAADADSGRELWMSDGTAAGTVLVKDIREGSDSASPRLLANVNGTLFFRADDGVNGAELWKSNGTAAGTVLVKDINPGDGSSLSYAGAINVGGTLFFVADSGENGRELWKSNGTESGTVLVKDINPGSGNSGIFRLAAIGGELFFSAEDGVNGRELWKSDGTTEGTVLVADIAEPGSSFPDGFVNVNGRLLFSASDDAHGRELWSLLPDEPLLPEISINDMTVTEKNTGTSNVTLTVTLSAASTQSVTLNYATSNGTAISGSDFIASTGTVTFAPGVTSRTIAVAVRGDSLDEADENFSVVLSAPTNATIADNTGIVTILDNDGPAISINNVAEIEGNGETKFATFTVTLSAASPQAVDVSFTTLPGTATEDTDYAKTTGTLSFAPGVTSKTLSVEVLGDTTDEVNETFSVLLSEPVNATIGKSTGVGTIQDDDGPTISIGDGSVSEGNTGTKNATLTVTLSEASTQRVTVAFATKNETAIAGSDFTATTGTVTFEPGMTSRTLSVPVRGDGTDEIDETFAVVLSAPVNATISDDNSGIVTIIDDDGPKISINDVSVAEGNTDNKIATFSVTLSARSPQSVFVTYKTSSGTATAGTDFATSDEKTLIFEPDEISKSLSVEVFGDLTDEINETFSVLLSSPKNGTIGDGIGVGTIQDDDGPTISINDVSVTERNAGTTNATFTLTLSAPSSQSVTVAYATANGAATGGSDFTGSTGTVTFAAGVTSRTLSVAVRGDSKDEIDETFSVLLSRPTNATILDSIGIGTIIDDDGPKISINDVVLTEGDSDSKNAMFTVTLSAASPQTVTVNFATANGSAHAGVDYTTSTGTLTFAPNTTSQKLSVAVLGDTDDEINETFAVILSSPKNGTIDDGAGAGTIQDDDGPTISVSDTSVTEGNSGTKNATFTVTLSASSLQTVTVTIATANGTAITGSDFTAATRVLTFAAGETSKTFSVLVRGDSVIESDEEFSVKLSTASNATISDATGTGTIRNDDLSPVSLLQVFTQDSDGLLSDLP